jgi:uncharacterized protein YndB with AHSA1/START domain
MAAALEIHTSIEITAPAETIWKVLTDNALIPQYMFGCVAETDWKPGSPLLWKGAADGKLYVKGTVIAFEPPHRLAYTIIDPNSSIPDIPENYLTVTCEVKNLGNGISLLAFTQGDFSKVANGEQRYNHSLDGDDFLLKAMKRLAEEQGQTAVS